MVGCTKEHEVICYAMHVYAPQQASNSARFDSSRKDVGVVDEKFWSFYDLAAKNVLARKPSRFNAAMRALWVESRQAGGSAGSRSVPTFSHGFVSLSSNIAVPSNTVNSNS